MSAQGGIVGIFQRKRMLTVPPDQPPYKQRKHATATLEYKVKVLDYFHAKQLGVSEAAKLFAIERSTLQTWLRNEAKLRQAPEKRHARQVPGAGRIPATKIYEETIVEYVKAHAPVSRSQIIQYCITEFNLLQDKSYNAQHQWVNRFIKRHALTDLIIKDVRHQKSANQPKTEDELPIEPLALDARAP